MVDWDNLTLKQTRVYQEIFEEGRQEGRKAAMQAAMQEWKLEIVSNMLESGMELERIAQLLELPLEVVQQEAEKKRQLQ